MGECSGDRPASEISVLDDSPPGEEAARKPKKELILWPGVLGCLASATLLDMDQPVAAMCRGGGRCELEGGCKPMVVALLGVEERRTGMKGSLTRRLCTGVPFENWELYSRSSSSSPAPGYGVEVSIRSGPVDGPPRKNLGSHKRC